MLVWLASYPRSGSHLIRTLLRNSFDLKSYDIYQRGEPELTAEEADVIGAARFPDRTAEAFVRRARQTDELHLVKTHGAVPAGDRCIYIVRDGRAALYSYLRYQNEVVQSPATLETIVRGETWAGSWAGHVERFFHRDPERTLVLRYEDLASREPPLARIAAFLGVEVKRSFAVPFSRMNALDPVRYSRGANDTGVRAVEEQCSVEFWNESRESMARAGYTGQGSAQGADRTRVFFYHLPKCAGTSIWSLLRKLAPPSDIMQVWSTSRARDLQQMPAAIRESYAVVGGHFDLGLYRRAFSLDRFVRVTVFREPVARAVSHYNYARSTPAHDQYEEIARQSFREFLEWDRNPIVTSLCGAEDPARALEAVRANFDLWGFVEDIPELTAELFARFDLPPPVVPRLNVGRGAFALNDLSASTDVRRLHAADCELFALLKDEQKRRRADAARSWHTSFPVNEVPVFCVVTPAMNSDAYLESAMESVIRQSGPFRIRYHIQDGGSTDRTPEIVREWQRRIDSGEFVPSCAGVSISFESREDGGMYDAIARGFELLGVDDGDYMTWINSDDMLAPRAMRTVCQAFEDMPEVMLVSGRPSLLDAKGAVISLARLFAVAARAVAAGIHDGRQLPCLTQEGTFWRGYLWSEAGGLNRQFRLAGDWDLWRRFCRRTEFVMLDTVTGYHRRRPGQLSENMAAYHSEVDTVVATLGLHLASAFELYAGAKGEAQFPARVARRDGQGRWLLTQGPLAAPPRQRMERRDSGWTVVSGFGDLEGPFPEHCIEVAFHWVTGAVGVIQVHSELAGERIFSLRLRSLVRKQAVTIHGPDGSRKRIRLNGNFGKEQVASFRCSWARGLNTIRIEPAAFVTTPEGRRLGVSLHGMFFAGEAKPALRILYRLLGRLTSRCKESPQPAE